MHPNSVRRVFRSLQLSILPVRNPEEESEELDRSTRRKSALRLRWIAHTLYGHQENVDALSLSYGNVAAMLAKVKGHTFSATDGNLLSGAETKPFVISL
jgi:hypothetical protein